MTTYDQEQQVAVDAAMVKLKRLESDPFVNVEHGTLHKRGTETWAIFGETAYRLYTEDLHEDGMLACEFVPVIVDGRAIGMWPDEGRGGVLHLQRMHLHTSGQAVANPQWFDNYLECSWLRADELNLSNQQIADVIAQEIVQRSATRNGSGS